MGTALRHWLRRGLLLVVLSAVVVIVGLVGGAAYLITRTSWGRERVRRVAEAQLGKVAHGKVHIGGISGNLISSATVHDVTITDSTGAPFVSVESLSGDYSLISLARKRIWIDHAVATRPRIVLDRPPDGKWNWDRIFPRGASTGGPHVPGWLDWLRFTNARVVDGQLVVRTPWHPETRLSRAARDSAVRVALAGKSRLMITRAGNGFQKLVQLDAVTARIPLLRLADPGQPFRLLEVSSLRMNAFPFHPPGAVVRDLQGVFPFNNDSVWWKTAYGEMPNTRASGHGSYVFDSGDLTLTLHGDPVRFSDLRWVYPRLPADGHGAGDLALSWRGALQDYAATNMNVALGGARIAGSFGITLDDTLTIHNTSLRFSGLETKTLEQLIQDFKSPRQGTLSGRATA